MIWSRNGQADTGARLPDWGFAGSPLVLHDLLIVATSGHAAQRDHVWRAEAARTGCTMPMPSPFLCSHKMLPSEGATRLVKPYFNDYVVHRDHAFGFDGTILSSISLAEGERKWKGGRYGAGQMLLLPEQDLLLGPSEEGDVALVEASPIRFTEVAKFKAIEGKTWNHGSSHTTVRPAIRAGPERCYC